MLSHFSHPTLYGPYGLQPATLPLSMGFPRQEYWSELPFPPSWDLPDPGIEPTSPVLADRFFTASATWEAFTDHEQGNNGMLAQIT